MVQPRMNCSLVFSVLLLIFPFILSHGSSPFILLLPTGIYKERPSSILHHSFLNFEYCVKEDEGIRFYVRQVPGDGGCLFHAIAVCISQLSSRRHLNFDGRMRKLSNQLRHIAVTMLSTPKSAVNPQGEPLTFAIENNETITPHELVSSAAEHYKMTKERYIEDMRRPKTWGGGPEIVAISNYLRRPIHVFNLDSYSALHGYHSDNIPSNPNSGLAGILQLSYSLFKVIRSPLNYLVRSYRLRRQRYLPRDRIPGTTITNRDGSLLEVPLDSRFVLSPHICIGSPAFGSRQPLYLLCADGRFPHIEPGDQKLVGDHFLALFPVNACHHASPDDSIQRGDHKELDDYLFYQSSAE